jgi:hypothetical protein
MLLRLQLTVKSTTTIELLGDMPSLAPSGKQ